MGKNGTIWHFFRALSPGTWKTLSPDALFARLRDTHANAQNLPHFCAFPASTQEHSPPKCIFFMANAKLPNRPGFALLQTLRGNPARACTGSGIRHSLLEPSSPP